MGLFLNEFAGGITQFFPDLETYEGIPNTFLVTPYTPRDLNSNDSLDDGSELSEVVQEEEQRESEKGVEEESSPSSVPILSALQRAWGGILGAAESSLDQVNHAISQITDEIGGPHAVANFVSEDGIVFFSSRAAERELKERLERLEKEAKEKKEKGD